MAASHSIPVTITTDLAHREMRLFTEDQVKRAFWACFHESGERFFDYLGGPEKNEASTADGWADFAEKLREQPIVALQAVDYFALLRKYARLVQRTGHWSIFPGIFFQSSLATQSATYPEAFEGLEIADTEWAELQRIASEVDR